MVLQFWLRASKTGYQTIISYSSAFTKFCTLMSKLKISSVAGCRYKQIYLKYEWWCLKHHIWWVGRVATSPEMHRTLQRDSRMCLWGAPSDPDQLILLWNMYFPNLHSLHRYNEIEYEYDELVVKFQNQGTNHDHNFLTTIYQKIFSVSNQEASKNTKESP